MLLFGIIYYLYRSIIRRETFKTVPVQSPSFCVYPDIHEQVPPVAAAVHAAFAGQLESAVPQSTFVPSASTEK